MRIFGTTQMFGFQMADGSVLASLPFGTSNERDLFVQTVFRKMKRYTPHVLLPLRIVLAPSTR